jgi:hypothetical protein
MFLPQVLFKRDIFFFLSKLVAGLQVKTHKCSLLRTVSVFYNNQLFHKIKKKKNILIFETQTVHFLDNK